MLEPAVLEKDDWTEYKDSATGRPSYCNLFGFRVLGFGFRVLGFRVSGLLGDQGNKTTWEEPAVLAKDDWTEHEAPATLNPKP